MLETHDLTFQYETEGTVSVPVIRGIDLTVERGSFVAIIGHNGSGKSTLAKHFNALLLPTGGQVLVEDMDTADEDNTYRIRRRVGMVLQNPDNQLVSTVVEEDVAFGPENLGIPPQEIRERVDEALRAVDMLDYRDRSPLHLSGGQKQRIAIAGVLAMRPDYLVLDEPTAMLDPQGRQEVLDILCRLNRESGMTVILITHYMEEAALADRIVVVDNGRTVADGTPRQIFSDPDRLIEIGLDVPQPVALCAALRRHGVDIPLDVLTPEECADAIACRIRD